MTSPDGLAMVQAAFDQGMRDADERQAYYMANPAGVPCGYDPEPTSAAGVPVGLGFSTPPEPIPVYVADSPNLIPSPVATPLAFDQAAGPALTGSVHGWGSVYPAAVAGRGSDFVYLGLGDEPAPPRRSLWRRLKGR